MKEVFEQKQPADSFGNEIMRLIITILAITFTSNLNATTFESNYEEDVSLWECINAVERGNLLASKFENPTQSILGYNGRIYWVTFGSKKFRCRYTEPTSSISNWPLPLRMVHIVHSSTGNPTPTHKTPAHAQRRLFGSGHLLQMYQLITEEMVLEGCANSHKRFSIWTRS